MGLRCGRLRPARPNGRNSTSLLSAGCGWLLGRTRPLFCWPSLSDSATACGRRFAASRRGRRSPPAGAGTLYQNIPARWPDAWKVSNSSSPVRELGGTYPPRRGGREPTLFGIPPKSASFLQPNSATERKKSMPIRFASVSMSGFTENRTWVFLKSPAPKQFCCLGAGPKCTENQTCISG